ncbi:MAG: CBS domain-containing protein [Acidobacteriota bacterium]|nr:CBS domain-containing protein [Acidobacteriota bacterium]
MKKFRIVDSQKTSVKLVDVAIRDSAKVDYPPVYRLYFFNESGELASLRWETVREIKLKEREISVEGFSGCEVFSHDVLEKEIFLFRDVLDAIIIDLQNRRVTRANDIWLEVKAGEITVRGADASVKAIFRRLSGGKFGKPEENEIYDWRYVEFLRGNPEAVKNGAGYNLRITRLAPGEIAGLIEAIPYLHAAELIVLLPDQLAASVLAVTALERQLQIFEELGEASVVKLLGMISPESAARILKQYSVEQVKSHLEKIPPERSKKILEILKFEDGTVGSIMTTDVVFIPENLTVREARERLTERLREPDFVYFIYAVDNDETRRLSGVVSLRRVVIASSDEKISDIMDKYVSFLYSLDDARLASFRIIDSHLAAMPVIDANGKLLGAVTIDAAVSTVAPSGWQSQAPRVFS